MVASERHFGYGDRQPAFAQVVASSHKTLADRSMYGEIADTGLVCVHRGDLSSLKLVDQGKVRAAQFMLGEAHEIDRVSRLLKVHRHTVRHIIDLADGADQQRRWNSNRLSSAGCIDEAELVIEAVLTADEGRSQRNGNVMTGQGSADD